MTPSRPHAPSRFRALLSLAVGALELAVGLALMGLVAAALTVWP